MQIWLATIAISIVLTWINDIQFNEYRKTMGYKLAIKYWFSKKFENTSTMEATIIMTIACIFAFVLNVASFLIPGLNIALPLINIINRDNKFYKSLQSGIESGYYVEDPKRFISKEEQEKRQNSLKPYEYIEPETTEFDKDFIKKYDKIRNKVIDKDFTDALVMDGASLKEVIRQYKIAKPELKKNYKEEKNSKLNKQANDMLTEIMTNTDITIEEKRSLLKQLRFAFSCENYENMQPINTALVLSRKNK